MEVVLIDKINLKLMSQVGHPRRPTVAHFDG